MPTTLIRWGLVVVGVFAIIFLVILMSDWHPLQGIGTPVTPTPPNTYYSDYPMNLEMRGSFGISGGTMVTLTHKVTYNGALEKYTYYYRVESKGNSVVLFEWDVLQPASNQIAGRSLLELTPGDPQEFTIHHTAPPALLNGMAAIYEKGDDGKWTVSMRALQPGPWPSNKYLPIEKTRIPDKKGIE